MRSCLWVLLMLGLLFPAMGLAALPPSERVPNPGADLWNEVRGRTVAPATSQVRGRDAAVLVNAWGERFRDYRRQLYVRYTSYLLAGVLVLILLFHVLHGSLKVNQSGHRLLRFDLYDRVAHWLLVLLFLFLAGTGLLLAFGRFVIIPWLGADAFSAVASACKEGHNLFGPLFIVALGWVFVRFVARNIPRWIDLIWILKGGGLLWRSHPSAGFFNAGEKLWFWLLAVLGLVLVVSGLALDFPTVIPGRDMLILSLVLHGGAAVILIAVSLGHIYIGTLGVKGTLEGMKSGMVDEEWARAHHDLWHARITSEQQSESNSGAPGQ